MNEFLKEYLRDLEGSHRISTGVEVEVIHAPHEKPFNFLPSDSALYL
jgi:hypothetical protein